VARPNTPKCFIRMSPHGDIHDEQLTTLSGDQAGGGEDVGEGHRSFEVECDCPYAMSIV
jgi:hypothetical protein